MKITELHNVEDKVYYCDNQQHLKLGSGKIFSVKTWPLQPNTSKYHIQKFYSQIFRPYGVFWPNERRSRNLPAKIKNETTTAASKTKFCEKTSSTPPSKSYQI